MKESDLDAKKWPCYPFLPLKNKQKRDVTNFPGLGVLAEVGGKVELCVYKVDLYQLQPNFPIGVEKESYNSVAEMARAGWEVD